MGNHVDEPTQNADSRVTADAMSKALIDAWRRFHRMNEAAPDMLAALKACVDSLEYIERTHQECTGAFRRSIALQKARAAISKATGAVHE